MPRIVKSCAPIRVCDNGGWTDTWFARYGRVFNIAVYPYAEVQMCVREHRGDARRITIHAENYGQTYTIAEPNGAYDKHPLLEAAIDYMRVPKDVARQNLLRAGMSVYATVDTNAGAKDADSLDSCLFFVGRVYIFSSFLSSSVQS